LIRRRLRLPPRLSNNHWRTIMKTNEGHLDRVLRVAAGLVLIGLAATGTVGIWGWIGVVPLLTGAIGVCPLYSVLGVNTCPVRR
jgi:fatty acid desaturase